MRRRENPTCSCCGHSGTYRGGAQPRISAGGLGGAATRAAREIGATQWLRSSGATCHRYLASGRDVEMVVHNTFVHFTPTHSEDESSQGKGSSKSCPQLGWHMLATRKQRVGSTGNEPTLDQTSDSGQSIALLGRLRAEMPTVAEECLTPVGRQLLPVERAGEGNSFVLHATLHYQEVVDKLIEGDEANFRPNAQNRYDPKAIEAHSNHGLLGCVPRQAHGKVRLKTRGNVHLFPYNKSKSTGVEIINLR
jgi:hypothetical protein